jgi:hypothetical protein
VCTINSLQYLFLTLLNEQAHLDCTGHQNLGFTSFFFIFSWYVFIKCDYPGSSLNSGRKKRKASLRVGGSETLLSNPANWEDGFDSRNFTRMQVCFYLSSVPRKLLSRIPTIGFRVLSLSTNRIDRMSNLGGLGLFLFHPPTLLVPRHSLTSLRASWAVITWSKSDQENWRSWARIEYPSRSLAFI